VLGPVAAFTAGAAADAESLALIGVDLDRLVQSGEPRSLDRLVGRQPLFPLGSGAARRRCASWDRGSGNNGTESHANVAASAHAFAPPDPSGVAFAQGRSTVMAYEPSHNEVGVRPWK